jgi:hypothetical protein
MVDPHLEDDNDVVAALKQWAAGLDEETRQQIHEHFSRELEEGNEA